MTTRRNSLFFSSIEVGETAKFQCQVSASNLNVQWLKDNKVLSGTNFRTSKNNNTYILELDNLTLEDASLYTIVASNAKESISSSSALNVLSGERPECGLPYNAFPPFCSPR